MERQYVCESEAQWKLRMAEIERIPGDRRRRAIAYLELALGDGAGFLALADREPRSVSRSEGTPEEKHKAACDFFEWCAAGEAQRVVHGLANAAFMVLPLEGKLLALQSVQALESSEADDQTLEDERGLNSAT
jgi:hypothetical protein